MDKEKHVDESWKEDVSEEKNKLGAETRLSDQTSVQSESSEKQASQAQDVEVNFLNYVTSLGFQAMIFMGEIPNPIKGEVDKNLTQAKFLIDTLLMIKGKTTGNLNDQEKNLLESSIYELQMRYVEVFKKEPSTEGEKTA